MKPTIVGASVGVILAFATLQFGLIGLITMALFMGLGAVIGRALENRVDFRAVRDALRGRRSSS